MTRAFVFTVAMGAWLLCEAIALGQGGGMGGGGMGGGGRGHGGMSGSGSSDSRKAPSDYYRGAAPPPTQINCTPHGGEYLVTETNHYEIVYMPLQTRIYLFDNKMKPLSARDVHAQMSLKLPSENAPRQIPFQYVAMPAGAAEQDYVVAVFDVRQLKDGETPITFEFSGLSDRRHPTAAFTPVFSPAKIRPYVARVPLTEADRDGVMRQRVCPVSGQMLGSQGTDRQAVYRRLSLVFVRGGLHCGGQGIAGKIPAAPGCARPRPVNRRFRRQTARIAQRTSRFQQEDRHMADNCPIFVISDLHMGDGGPRDNFPLNNREKELGLFLDYVAGQQAELIVLGDLFEFWQMNLSKIVVKHLPLLDRLAAMNATYVLGNHDADFDHFIGTGFLAHPLFQRMCGPFERQIGGKRFKFMHGHEVDPVNAGDTPGKGESSASSRGCLKTRTNRPYIPTATLWKTTLRGSETVSWGRGPPWRAKSAGCFTWADWEWRPSILPPPKTLIGPRNCSTSTGRIWRTTATMS